MNFRFSKDFLFGAASSAVQIESARKEGGKGADVHDQCFADSPERYAEGDLNDGADFYHRYPEDIKKMKELGLKAFRFSISWSRIYPDGPDKINSEGLDYYNDMVDHLLEAGIKPFFDLWHCDLPLWVAERGGILNPEFPDWFTTYAKSVFEVLGDKVAFWSTVNEPHVNCMEDLWQGIYPPYIKDHEKAIHGSHNMIIAHYRTIRLYKEMGYKGQIGAVVYLPPCYGASSSPEDQAAAARYQDYQSGWWLDTMLKGYYPSSVLEYPYIKEKMPKGFKEQLEKEFVPCDFISINYYDPFLIKYEPGEMLDCKIIPNPNLMVDDYGFTNYPQGLFDALVYLRNTYPGMDIYISENGTGIKTDSNPSDKELNDDYRINYMREHLREVSRAISAGVPVKGYFHWTIMDTSEHVCGGYTLKFGLLQVDFETKKRTPRKSWYYYQNIICKGFVD